MLAALEQAKSDGRIKPGQFHTIDICHDDWCQTQQGGTRCNCNPAIGTIRSWTQEEFVEVMLAHIRRRAAQRALPGLR